jgi:hypothetical protein
MEMTPRPRHRWPSPRLTPNKKHSNLPWELVKTLLRIPKKSTAEIAEARLEEAFGTIFGAEKTKQQREDYAN